MQFRSFRNSSVIAAAKSLVNFFRDFCPQLLPKKFRGRFTAVADDDQKENLIYGKQKINYGIDGLELLVKEGGAGIAKERILDEEDFKRIRVLKLRKAVKKVDRKGFASSDDEEKEEEDSGDEGSIGESDEDDEEEEEYGSEEGSSQSEDEEENQSEEEENSFDEDEEDESDDE